VRNVFLRYSNGSTQGWGEHAPAPAVTGESLEDVRREVAELVKNPDWVQRLLEDAGNLPLNVPRAGARNALTTAWVDASGRAKDEPAHRVLNLPEGRSASSATVSIGSPKEAVASALEHQEAGWPCLKVKVGGKEDEAVLRALRDRLPGVPLRVDANEAWSLQRAKEMLGVLHRLEVEFVEQPLARDDWDGLAELTGAHELPILLDESVLDSEGLMRAIRAGAGDGVVVKLAKCGGPFEARRMVKMARDHGWKIMMGCMIESSVAIAMGAAFAGAVDYLDLDGSALIKDDPFVASVMREGRISTPDGPGLGVERAETGAALEPLGS
jgi:L-alanine-DL-glutamate epimerase-like enolase superfamily enzyme